jgi:hypothetical protein
VERFLELHGNAALREASGEYVAQRGKLLADVALACSAGERPGTDASERSRLLALFDLSLLRYKERDALVDVFRRHAPPARALYRRPGLLASQRLTRHAMRSYGAQVPFAMASLRDERLRAFYGCAPVGRCCPLVQEHQS